MISAKRFEPIALRQARLFESDDLDRTRDQVSRVMQPHRLVPGASGSVRSHMDFVRVGGIGMGALNFGAAMQVDTGHLDDYYLLMFCLTGHADAHVDGQAVAVNQARGMICSPERPFAAMLSADCEQFMLRIDRATVAAHTGANRLVFDRELDLDSAALQPWLAQLRAMATSPELLQCAMQNPKIAVELERLLICLLTTGQRWSDEADLVTPTIAPRCVRKAESFIEERASDAIRLEDIAAAADVPVRTLLAGFRRFRDITPMQYLRDVRLGQARDLLRRAPAGSSVSAIALDCGFLHLGRFAQAYQQRFGESPSETLRRSC
ncbi:AraC-like DNA-binding protein [Pigmentiphaga litoralis]|uniref:AraC-like DNA-binding protein n=1 Tax=Pigmentiphaga litoralis TaxID=516702 RepID=A0A7Y9IU15_9BURK|nr:anthranilate 1,2-dioxygenase regulatory protein AndR [Pigmentiphaga litoralis]NYE23324.1 AraC-like DNA-binding protein [Pigmentiphaga litoralis]NYE83062.1 AraC-like DNA-binding protein [Pigmentiphaga litoralis]